MFAPFDSLRSGGVQQGVFCLGSGELTASEETFNHVADEAGDFVAI